MSGTNEPSARDVRARSVAIVGSGPSGLYAAAALVKGDPSIQVDVIDRLPTPYGLVRYGVAPDHPNIKAVDKVLAKPFGLPNVRFRGNVDVGTDVHHEDLMAHYDAVIYATGSQVDRELGSPGESLKGSVGSAEFVAWYSGHPDTATVDLSLAFPGVVVVGGGNVALDVARVLAKSADELSTTDIPDDVLAVLRSSAVTDIHVLVRRGPSAAKFSYLELLSLGELAGVDIVVHGAEKDDTVNAEQPTPAEADRVARNIALVSQWNGAPSAGLKRRIHLHFNTRVGRILGEEYVEAVEIVSSSDAGEATSTLGEIGMVVRAVGYTAVALPGLPFDAAAGIVPNRAGRVLDNETVVPRLYVTGWLKRGPQGVIATNKIDGGETAKAVLEDFEAMPPGVRPTGTSSPADHPDLVDWEGWLRIDADEAAAGASRGAVRVKHPDRSAMVRVGSTRGKRSSARVN